MRSFLYEKTETFLLLFGLFLFQDKLQEVIPVFQYFDEAFALIVIHLLAYRLIRRGSLPRLTRTRVWAVALMGIFWISGWLGYLVYQYQPLKQTAMDSFVNIKFFLAVGTSFLLFWDDHTSFDKIKAALWPVLNVLTVVLFALCVVNLFSEIFPTEPRGILRAVKLYYSSYTVLVGACTLLCAAYLWFYQEHGKKIVPYLIMLSFVMYCTRRVKGIGAIACIVVVYLFILLGKGRFSKKVKIGAFVVVGLAAVAGAYQLISYYITMGVGSARAMLTIASPFVAWDHFPFGSGWGTFGSAFSGDPYSPVYGMYRMAGIWGLSPEYHAFISDTYWPMLLGECGFFGFAAFLGGLYLFVKRILKLGPNRSAYASAVFVLLYLLISSTSESALANPIAVPLAFWLGFLLAEQRSEVRR